jgi:hypothetical protein
VNIGLNFNQIPNIACQTLIFWHAVFAVNLGPDDKKACIMVGLYGVLHVVETVAVDRVA